MRLLIFLSCVSITASSVSCSRELSSDIPSAVESPPSSASAVPPESPASCHWTLSRDGKLALRLRALAKSVAMGESFVVIAEIENRSTERLTILRPFGDDFIAVSHGIEIRNEQGKLAYSGAQRTYVIGAGGFASVEPGKSVEDKLELPIANYAGIENVGRYTLQYDYSYRGEWDTTAAKGGIRDAWRGRIRSEDVEFTRQN